MSTFETILLVLLVLDAIALGVLVLIQQGQGASVGAAFGSGASNTMFGSGGSTTFLTKITVGLAIGYFLISFGLAYAAKERAVGISDIGVPEISQPLVPAQELTPEPESVDSDIPDVCSFAEVVKLVDTLP